MCYILKFICKITSMKWFLIKKKYIDENPITNKSSQMFLKLKTIWNNSKIVCKTNFKRQISKII